VIGLGQATAIKSLEVFWPTTDKTQLFEDVEPQRLYRVTEGNDRLEELAHRSFSFRQVQAD
jgi:hypothetical protein